MDEIAALQEAARRKTQDCRRDSKRSDGGKPSRKSSKKARLSGNSESAVLGSDFCGLEVIGKKMEIQSEGPAVGAGTGSGSASPKQVMITGTGSASSSTSPAPRDQNQNLYYTTKEDQVRASNVSFTHTDLRKMFEDYLRTRWTTESNSVVQQNLIGYLIANLQLKT